VTSPENRGIERNASFPELFVLKEDLEDKEELRNSLNCVISI